MQNGSGGRVVAVRKRRLIALAVILPAVAFCVSAAVGQDVQVLSGPQRVVVQPGGGGGMVLEAPASAGPGQRPAVLKRPDDQAKKPTAEEKPNGEKKAEKEKGEGKGEEKKKSEKGDQEEKPDKSPEPIQRPSKPDEEPNPEELKLRPDEEGKIRFNFTGQPWPGVLKWLADTSGMSLDWQELPGDYLNLITQRGYTLAEARDLINRHLLARGYTLLQQGEVLSVFKVDKLNAGMVPRVAPEELAERMPYEFVKVSFVLDWLMAEEAVAELKPMLSPNGKLTALKATNRIEAMDAVLNLSQIYQLLKQEQSDTSEDALVREFVLKHSLAEEVVEQLNSLLGIEKKGVSKGPMTPQQMEQKKREAAMRAQQQQHQKQGKAPPPKSQPKVYLVANRRNNSILANAPPDKMAIIEQAIRVLDVPSGYGQSLLQNLDRMQVYRLETVDPKAVVDTLKELGRLDFDTRLEVDEENHAIVAYASLADHVTIRSLVEKLDRGGRRSQVIPLTELKAEVVAEKIDFVMGGGREKEKEPSSRDRGRSFSPFFPFGGFSSSSRSRGRAEQRPADRFRVDADTKNNALILWCNDFELTKVESLLEQLRAMPKQEGDLHSVEVFRLATLEPGPLVETLKETDALGVHASVRADEENHAVVVFGTEEDHQKIRALIERLDGSQRQFEVVQLRRLPADYVAGTIQFMMSTGQKDQPSLDRYAYYPYTSRRRPEGSQKEEGFRVEADVENNRLLMLANEVELKEVMNLLVKLGEIPPQEGNPSTVRVLDSLPEEELHELLEQLRRAWPSVAPNPLILPEKEEESPRQDAEPAPTPPGDSVKEETAGAPPAGKGPLEGRTGPPRGLQPPLHFAQLETSPSAPAGPADEKPPAAHENHAAGSAESSVEAPPRPDVPGPQAREEGPKKGESPSPPAPVTILRRPDGRLVLSSPDTQALDRLEELLATLAPRRPDYKIFRLKYAWAFSVALTLEDIFKEEEKGQRSSRRGYYDYYDFYGYGGNEKSDNDSLRLSKRRPIKFISDTDSNSILVKNADPRQLKRIEELIKFYDQPEPTDSQSVRKTQIVKIRYSTASVIANAVKDVFRDLLSANDKALASGQQKPSPERSYTFIYDSSGSGEQRKAPSFKGLLSLGVDDLSNTLVVSAPAYFLDDILQVVEDLDEAAEPAAERVEVVQLGDAVSADHVRRVLATILQQSGPKAGPKKGTPPKPPGPNGPGGRPRGGEHRR